MAKNNVVITESSGLLSIKYDVQRCKKCILSSNFPETVFDIDGLCNYCKNDSGLSVSEEAHKQALNEMYTLIRNQPNQNYDCLVLYSGGKDSSYALFVVKNELKLNPLALTIDNGFMAQAVVPNMQTVLNNLNIDHALFRPSNHFMKSLYKTTIDQTADNKKDVMYATASCGSCISVVLSIGARECMNRHIPVMMGGWSPGQLTELPLLPGNFLEEICSTHFSKLSLKNPNIKNKIEEYRLKESCYPALYNPLYGIRYNENVIYSTLEKIGWVKPKDTDSCSSNCRLNGFLVIDHIRKYGFHPYEYELAFHVRNGLCSRNEALNKITDISFSQSTITSIERHFQGNAA